MGCFASTLGEVPESGELRRLSDTLTRIGCQRSTVNSALQIFGQADKDGSGSIGIAEFATMFSLRTSNVFLPRLLSLFDVSGDGDIGALEFVLCLAQFFTSNQHAHIYFAWRLFDQDDSGSMNSEEFQNILYNTMNYMGRSANTDAMHDRHVILGRAGARVKVKGFATLIKEADIDDNGVITIDEFKVLASHSPHLVAPAFELWSALEQYSKPCYALKQEIMKSGRWKEVSAMINPKAAAAMRIGQDGEQKARRPRRPSDSRAAAGAPQVGRKHERRRAPRSGEPPSANDGLNNVNGAAHESRQMDVDGLKASKEGRHHRRSHHHEREGDERQHRSHRHHRDDRDGRHRKSERGHRHRGNPHRTEEMSPSQYYGGGGGAVAGGGRGERGQQEQFFGQGIPPMGQSYSQAPPHMYQHQKQQQSGQGAPHMFQQQQQYGQGDPHMYQQQYSPQSPAYSGGYDDGRLQQSYGNPGMRSPPLGSPVRGHPPRRSHDDEILNQLERDLGL
jgi:Ca2+-binding EF-hand superfamily protein